MHYRAPVILAFLLGAGMLGGTFHPWVVQVMTTGPESTAMLWFIRVVAAGIVLFCFHMWRVTGRTLKAEADLDATFLKANQAMLRELLKKKS